MKQARRTNNNNPDWRKIFIQLQKRAYKKRYIIFLSVLLISMIVIFFGFFRMIFFLLLLLALNTIASFIGKHMPRASTSIELIMFSTVLAGTAYGARVAAIYGAISAILYYYAAGRFSYYVAIFAPLYSIIGIASAFFSNVDILTLGMICTISYTAISSIIVILLFNAKIDKAIIFGVINTAFNFIMFKYLAPIFIALM